MKIINKILKIFFILMLIFICYQFSYTYASNEYISNENLTYKELSDGTTLISGFEIGTKVSEITNDYFSSEYTVKIFDDSDNEITNQNDKVIGSGCTVKLYTNSDTLAKTYTVVVYGDTSGDGNTNSVDPLIIVKNKLGQILFKNSAVEEAGRINENARKTGDIPSAVDALAIVKYKLSPEEYPIIQKLYIQISSIELNETVVSLKTGETLNLTATVSPNKATYKTVTWTSNDTSIATVSNNGTVTAISTGTAQIQAVAGGYEALCTVTVIPATVEVSSITLNPTIASLKVGETLNLTATVSPNNATDKTVTWTSSDTSIATVSNNGTVTGISVGTATIQAVTGGKEAICYITVEKNSMYVALYGEGTLEFTNTETTIISKPGMTLVKSYGCIDDYYQNDEIPPWYEDRESILKVNFADVVSPPDTYYWFLNCNNLHTIENVKNLNTSCVRRMFGMFQGCYSLETLDLSSFDTTNVTDISYMFYGCQNLSEIRVGSDWTRITADTKKWLEGCGTQTFTVIPQDRS